MQGVVRREDVISATVAGSLLPENLKGRPPSARSLATPVLQGWKEPWHESRSVFKFDFHRIGR